MGYHSLILAWGPFPFPPGIYYSFLNRELISPPLDCTGRIRHTSMDLGGGVVFGFRGLEGPQAYSNLT